jgi:hypothetical protein
MRLTPCRCFPHIINLAAQDFVDALKHTPADPIITDATLRSLRSDVVTRLRELIVACRLTSLRREEWRRTIIGMRHRGKVVPFLALIYDIITRWSATFNMIQRYLLMQEVSKMHA